MGAPQIRPDNQAGAARIHADGTVSFLAGHIRSVEHPETGVYRINLETGIPPDAAAVRIQRIGDDELFVRATVEFESTSVLTVRFFNVPGDEGEEE